MQKARNEGKQEEAQTQRMQQASKRAAGQQARKASNAGVQADSTFLHARTRWELHVSAGRQRPVFAGFALGEASHVSLDEDRAGKTGWEKCSSAGCGLAGQRWLDSSRAGGGALGGAPSALAAA